MVSSIAERIATLIETMPAGERRAAHALVADYPMLGMKTVAEFALRAGVSSPTILRFVARLGFQRYPDFQATLQDELAAQLQSPLSRSALPPRAGGEAPPALEATLDNIRATFQHLSPRQLGEIVTLLADPRAGVFLVGGRFTDPLARYMAAHLAVVRPGVHHLAGQEAGWRDRLLDIGRRDVLVAFDIRRYQDGLARFCEAAHARRARIVLVTDQWLSPIARFASQVVAARTAVPSAWDSSASLFVAVEILIGELTLRLGADGARRMAELEALREP